MPRLSVLMTARNSEATITRAIASTLRSLPPDSELLVLDDGSSDGTREILERVSDARFASFSSHHIGIANGLNLLLEKTSSDVVARMDADDICLPGRLKRELASLRRGTDVVFTTVVEFGPSRWRVAPHSPRGISPSAFRYHLLLTNPVAHPTMLARRSAVARSGGYRDLPSEDYDLWLRMAAEGIGMRRLARPGLAYRRHAGQVTASAAWRRQSWSNPMTSEAYGALSTKLLGEGFLRLPTLASQGDITFAESDEILSDFSSRFVRAIQHLSHFERALLTRKCDERVRWARRARVALAQEAE